MKNVLLVNALLLILFLSDTYGDHVHDKRIADATPYPLPVRSRLLQDLGFLSFTLPEVEILMPASSVVALCKTGSACGSRGSAIW